MTDQQQAALYRVMRAHYLTHREQPSARVGHPLPKGGMVWAGAKTEDEYDRAMSDLRTDGVSASGSHPLPAQHNDGGA